MLLETLFGFDGADSTIHSGHRVHPDEACHPRCFSPGRPRGDSRLGTRPNIVPLSPYELLTLPSPTKPATSSSSRAVATTCSSGSRRTSSSRSVVQIVAATGKLTSPCSLSGTTSTAWSTPSCSLATRPRSPRITATARWRRSLPGIRRRSTRPRRRSSRFNRTERFVHVCVPYGSYSHVSCGRSIKWQHIGGIKGQIPVVLDEGIE